MPGKILVIDDDRFMRQVLSDLLGGEGYQVILAADGEEGCRLAGEELPDAILVDLVMPRRDGIETCRALRADPRFAYTPILMMTSSADMQARVNPFRVGADDYLAKPFEDFELLARLAGNLAKRRAIRALEDRARDSEALLEISASVTSSLDTVEILRRIVARIADLLKGVYRCSIALIQEDERFGHVLASSDNPDLPEVCLDLQKYPEIREVMRSGEPLLIENVEQDPILDEVRSFLPEEKFNTILVLPVIYQERVIGALVVRALRSGAGISPAEVSFCQLVANVSANALKNAHHFARIREEWELLRFTKKRLEEELGVKATYELLFENASEGLAAFSRTGRIVYANRKALELTGYGLEELAARSLGSLLDVPSLRRILQARQALEGGATEVPRFDVRIRTRSGRERLLSVSLSAEAVASGLQVAAFRDVTDRRRMERELKETKAVLEYANERLQKLDRSRAEFFNTAAHELRIPVTIVSGYCSLLQETGQGNLTTQQREFVDSAVESCDRLVDLVNNMLDLSRLNAGKMQMEIASRDLLPSVREVCREVGALASRNGLELAVEAPAECPALFDDEKIERVLYNLVGNAIKFTTPGGRIRVSIRPGDGETVIAVADTGKGIPPERIPELFDEFTQVGREDSQQGTGLGLSICRKIVESHQGRIWAESRPGEGSTFFFSLPHPA